MGKAIHAPYAGLDLPQVVRVDALRPLVWLRMGWNDYLDCFAPSTGQGLLLVLAGWLILLFCSVQVYLLGAAIAGFLLLGPLVATGFYELSRLRSLGESATVDASIEAAIRSGERLVPLGSILALLTVAWVVLSAVVLERGLGGTLPSIGENLYRTVLDWSNSLLFATFLATGAVFALLAFVVSVISVPMIFDRSVDTPTGVLTSVKVVAANPGAMAVWAVLIAALMVMGFATFLLGLAVILPLLGHATWHCYRDLVE